MVKIINGFDIKKTYKKVVLLQKNVVRGTFLKFYQLDIVTMISMDEQHTSIKSPSSKNEGFLLFRQMSRTGE